LNIDVHFVGYLYIFGSVSSIFTVTILHYMSLGHLTWVRVITGFEQSLFYVMWFLNT